MRKGIYDKRDTILFIAFIIIFTAVFYFTIPPEAVLIPLSLIIQAIFSIVFGIDSILSNNLPGGISLIFADHSGLGLGKSCSGLLAEGFGIAFFAFARLRAHERVKGILIFLPINSGLNVLRIVATTSASNAFGNYTLWHELGYLGYIVGIGVVFWILLSRILKVRATNTFHFFFNKVKGDALGEAIKRTWVTKYAKQVFLLYLVTIGCGAVIIFYSLPPPDEPASPDLSTLGSPQIVIAGGLTHILWEHNKTIWYVNDFPEAGGTPVHLNRSLTPLGSLSYLGVFSNNTLLAIWWNKTVSLPGMPQILGTISTPTFVFQDINTYYEDLEEMRSFRCQVSRNDELIFLMLRGNQLFLNTTNTTIDIHSDAASLNCTMAGDSNNNTYVFWQRQGVISSDPTIHVQVYYNGSMTSPVPISTLLGGITPGGFPTVWIDEDNVMNMVWVEEGHEILYTHNRTGAFIAPVLLLDHVFPISTPQLQGDKSGNVYLTCYDTNNTIQFGRVVPSGTVDWWTASAAGEVATKPNLAVREDGSVILAWLKDATWGSLSSSLCCRKFAGNAFGEQVCLSAPS